MKIAMVTYPGLPQLTASDRLMISLFAERAIHAEPAVWSDPAVRWQDFAVVLMRSAWDSHLDPQAFDNWLAHLAKIGVHVLNPIPLIRQNQHKFHLRELGEAGVRIIPTVFISRTDRLDLGAVRSRGWKHAVIKPAISANSYFTERFAVDDYAVMEQKYRGIARERELLVQEFMPEIQDFGEISLVFINRKYSHAILKRARQADFRVQAEYGGQ